MGMRLKVIVDTINKWSANTGFEKDAQKVARLSCRAAREDMQRVKNSKKSEISE
jgi:hypothetical protein